MKPSVHALDRRRTMVLTTEDELETALEERDKRPIVALLTDSVGGDDRQQLVAIVVRLLAVGCDYFVCFGRDSERVHDEIDAIIDAIVEQEAAASECSVITTWHVDETSDDVAEFFVNVAGARDASVLVGIVSPDDNALQVSLRKLAARTIGEGA